MRALILKTCLPKQQIQLCSRARERMGSAKENVGKVRKEVWTRLGQWKEERSIVDEATK